MDSKMETPVVIADRHPGGEFSPLLRSNADDGCDKNTGIGDAEFQTPFAHFIADDDKVFVGSTGSWLRLLLFFAACVISGGVLPGQNVYNRLFCEAGLFSYACREDTSGGGVDGIADDPDFFIGGDSSCCSTQWLLLANTMNALSSTLALFFFLGGLVFDSLGGQWTSIVGCLINAAGFFVLSLLLFALQEYDDDVITITPWMETTIFCFAIILVDAGSIITNVSFFGFLWHLPRHQGLILSLSNCCVNVAAVVPLVLRFILQRYDNWLSLPSTMFFYTATIVGIATPACWVAVPSVENYRKRAMEVLGVPIPRRTVKGFRGAIDSVKSGFRIIKHHARLHLFTLATFTFAWTSSFIYITMTDPLGQEVFGTGAGVADDDMVVMGNSDENGERLAVLFNQCSALVGLFMGPLVGVMLDQYSRPTEGITDLAVVITISMAIIGVFCPVANWTIQTIVVTSGAFGQIATLLFIMRYSVIFALPNRVGAVSGILLALLGGFSMPFFILLSIYIVVTDHYVGPTIILSLIGAAVWVAYIVFLKRAKPWPSSPVLLPEDERNISKMFSVGTIEDAAFVAGKSLPEFRRLLASSKAVDQRALLDAAFAPETGDRIMEVARRRSSVEVSKRNSIGSQNSASSAYPRAVDGLCKSDNANEYTDALASRYSIPLYLASGNVRGEEFTIRRGSASTALETIEISFNGHGGFGGRNEPSIASLMDSMGPPDDPRRIFVMHSMFAPAFHCAEAYGNLLEVRVGDFTVASCACFHPDGLENGSIFQVGSDRYYYSLTMSGATPNINRETMGPEALQRFVSFKQDSRWDELRNDYGPVFYVAVLGVHPSYQGRGYGKKLLNIVAHWADREGMDCYLECSEANVAIYERCGYENIWKVDVEIDGSNDTLTNFGMVRRCKNKE